MRKIYLIITTTLVFIILMASSCTTKTVTPYQIILSDRYGTNARTISMNEVPHYESISLALNNLVNNLGVTLSTSELNEYQENSSASSDGITMTMHYSSPVILLSTDGKLLADAKLVSIQWNRSGGKPNRLFYSTECTGLFEGNVIYKQVIDGGYVLNGDVTPLNNAVSSLIMSGTIITGTNGGTTVIATASPSD